MFSKNLIKTVSIGALLLTSAAYAEKPNFSYSSLGLSIGSVSYKDDICIGGSCTSTASASGVDGSLQLGDIFVLSLSGTAMKLDASAWNADISAGEFGVGIALPVSNTVDFNAGISSASIDVDTCGFGSCVKESDTGTRFGGGLRAWLNDTKTFSGSVGYNTFKASKSTDRVNSYNIGIAAWLKTHHKLSLSYGSNSDATSTAFGYSYVF